MQKERICPRCHNRDSNYFYRGVHGYYCRKCISFGCALVEEERRAVPLQPIADHAQQYALQYPLTEKQKEIAEKASKAIETKDVLIQAVCGAGKTEMSVPILAQALSKKQKVCFAIARRQVVLELTQRLKRYFPRAKVVGVCGGHTKQLDGDLIICTTHQLFRYYQAFDLLILDEPDAFPYRGDPVLHAIAQTSCKGHILYLTATPDAYLRKEVEAGNIVVFHLHERPHHHPLPIPKIQILPKILLFPALWIWLRRHHQHPCILFVPTIRMAEWLAKMLHQPCVTSVNEERDAIIEQFRLKGKGILIATTVLERGVTIPDADVCVFLANHRVFDEAGLIQMAGRAGRNFQNPYGDVLFLCSQKSDIAMRCQKQLQEDNDALSAVS